VTERILEEQVAYYRRRAAEYDATAYGDLAAAGDRIDRITSRLRLDGRILELACGTGMWTRSIAGRATELIAVDTSPEALAIARTRCPETVELVCADALEWLPDRRYDVVFFAFWLSHVPSSRLDGFFGHLQRLLTPAGRVVFVDEHVSRADNDAHADLRREVAERTLGDGSIHRLVKVYVDPGRLRSRLEEIGWASELTTEDNGWVVGVCRPAASAAL